ncbi:hypothetical protein HF086_011986 [Spodoptera exigua]|uniref:SH3 domain-containing protein n=1 Tax=Spodoptera exigua TaxID=7107 RepID=A0A922MIL7_SPOEX|nr:hypothetical protein HF086_011986 [Spodoptera exigua]
MASDHVLRRVADPTTWQNPLKAIANYTFVATSPQELTIHENQIFHVAPTHLQQHLMPSGWLMATTDGKSAGLVPVNYFKVITPTPTEQKPGDKTENIAPPPGLEKKTT